jgi:O-antigen/teichoic acid export membrane protein
MIIYKTNNSNTYQALWLGISSFSSFTLSIISAAILSRYFDKEEYGTYRQILYVYNTFLVIFSAGLPNIFSYYLPRYNLAKGKDVVWKITKMLLFFGALFSLFLFACSEFIAGVLKNPELKIGMKYFSPIPLLLMPTLGIEGIFATYRKTIYVAIYNTLTRVLMLAFIVLPVIIFKGTYLYAIYGWIISSIITLILAYVFKNKPFEGITLERSGLRFKDIFLFSLPLLMSSIFGMAIKAADQFYISRFFGTVVFAEFSNGFIQLPFAQMITAAVSTTLLPVFSKLIFTKAEHKLILELWQNALNKSAIIIYPMAIFFIFYAKESIIILYSIKYEPSTVYFIISMLINFFNVIAFAPLILAMGETKFYARLHLGYAISSWINGYIIVTLFRTPVAISIFSAMQSILLVLTSLFFISKKTNIYYFDLFPIVKLSIIALHSIIAIIFIKILFSNFLQITIFNIYLIILAFISYIIILLLTAPFFKINYAILFKAILNK